MCDAFDLWATPIGYLGKITELAFGDIDAKCADIKNNRNQIRRHLKMDSDTEMSLNSLLDAEIDLGLSKCNGYNNADFLDPSQAEDWQMKYVSSGR